MATESTADAGHAAAEIGACVNDAGGAIGMPQLCVDWMPNQIFWLVVTLAVIYLVLSRIALPRIGGVLAERKGTITNDLTAAEELKAKVVEAEKAYQDALLRARAEAARVALPETARPRSVGKLSLPDLHLAQAASVGLIDVGTRGGVGVRASSSGADSTSTRHGWPSGLRPYPCSSPPTSTNAALTCWSCSQRTITEVSRPPE